jgi:hypothetical protein
MPNHSFRLNQGFRSLSILFSFTVLLCACPKGKSNDSGSRTSSGSEQRAGERSGESTGGTTGGMGGGSSGGGATGGAGSFIPPSECISPQIRFPTVVFHH